VLNHWHVASSRICAPHQVACPRRQTFIGHHIGAVANPRQVVVAYIEPVVGAGRHNRVRVSRLAVARRGPRAGQAPRPATAAEQRADRAGRR
jgi:hypothetical protein